MRTMRSRVATYDSRLPIDRSRVSRRSADLSAELIGDGWSLVIFPEGGRSPDGWGQEFRGGAAYQQGQWAARQIALQRAVASTSVGGQRMLRG